MITREDPIDLAQPPVSSLEQASPRCHVRVFLCFPLPQDYDQKHVYLVLDEALRQTTSQLPFLKSELVPDLEATRNGSLKLVAANHGSLASTDLRLSSHLDYENLRSKHFPAAAFDDSLCATPQLVDPASPIAIFAARAVFIKGGLLLALSTFHTIFDGTDIHTLLALWAQNCRLIQDPSSKPDIQLPTPLHDNSRLDKPSTPTNRGHLSDHPELTLLPEDPTALLSSLSKIQQTEIYHISPASLTALKSSIQPPSHPPFSTNDALTALIWRAIITSTYGPTTPPPPLSLPSKFLIATNARRQLSPPLPPSSLGCALTFTSPTLPLEKIFQPPPLSLPQMAIEVRRSVTEQTTPAHLASLLTLLSSPSTDFSRLGPSCFEDLMGRHGVITSWARFPLYGLEWGGIVEGGRMERVRTPVGGMFNGLQVIFPELPESVGGGFEVAMGMEEEGLGRLRGDWEGWGRWAVGRG